MSPKLPRIDALHRLSSAVRGRVHAIGERLLQVFVLALIVRTMQEMSEDDATHMAAGVAYYGFFSLFPLMLGMVAIIGYLPESETVETNFTDFAADFLPGSDELIDSNLESVRRFRGSLGIVAIFGLLWSASAIFGAVTRSVNRAWDVHRDRPFYISKPRQMLMAFGVGVLFILSLSSAALVRVSDRLTQFDVPGLRFLVDIFGLVLLQGTAFLLTLMIFLVLYKFTPNTRTYWRYIWPGAVVAAVLFETVKNLFIFYLNSFTSFESVYGSLAPIIVLLLWTYVSSLILIMGAELSSEYGRMREGVGRGVLLQSREGYG